MKLSVLNHKVNTTKISKTIGNAVNFAETVDIIWAGINCNYANGCWKDFSRDFAIVLGAGINHGNIERGREQII